jgi:hypothetical protein
MSIGNDKQNKAIAERVMGWTTKYVVPRRYGKTDDTRYARLWANDGRSRFVCPNFTWHDARIAEKKAMQDGWVITTSMDGDTFIVVYERNGRHIASGKFRDQVSMDALCSAYGITIETE